MHLATCSLLSPAMNASSETPNIGILFRQYFEAMAKTYGTIDDAPKLQQKYHLSLVIEFISNPTSETE